MNPSHFEWEFLFREFLLIGWELYNCCWGAWSILYHLGLALSWWEIGPIKVFDLSIASQTSQYLPSKVIYCIKAYLKLLGPDDKLGFTQRMEGLYDQIHQH